MSIRGSPLEWNRGPLADDAPMADRIAAIHLAPLSANEDPQEKHQHAWRDFSGNVRVEPGDSFESRGRAVIFGF
jgi:hypothetical protein